ncbi:hypothetical protein B5S32_g536 [[Candida] boidinii]|nr:hypothetical protein B5S32_g536 [[Candida] boidinii]
MSNNNNSFHTVNPSLTTYGSNIYNSTNSQGIPTTTTSTAAATATPGTTTHIKQEVDSNQLIGGMNSYTNLNQSYTNNSHSHNNNNHGMGGIGINGINLPLNSNTTKRRFSDHQQVQAPQETPHSQQQLYINPMTGYATEPLASRSSSSSVTAAGSIPFGAPMTTNTSSSSMGLQNPATAAAAAAAAVAAASAAANADAVGLMSSNSSSMMHPGQVPVQITGQEPLPNTTTVYHLPGNHLMHSNIKVFVPNLPVSDLAYKISESSPTPPFNTIEPNPRALKRSVPKVARRKSKFTNEQDQLIIKLKREGKTWVDIADLAGVGTYLAARNRYQVLIGQQGGGTSECGPDDAVALQSVVDTGEIEKFKFIAKEFEKRTGKSYNHEQVREFIRFLFWRDPEIFNVNSGYLDELIKLQKQRSKNGLTNEHKHNPNNLLNDEFNKSSSNEQDDRSNSLSSSSSSPSLTIGNINNNSGSNSLSSTSLSRPSGNSSSGSHNNNNNNNNNNNSNTLLPPLSTGSHLLPPLPHQQL